MPASYVMSWEPKSRRWWKQRDGKRYVVSVRQLKRQGYLGPDAVATKEATYRAANRWWEDRVERGVGPRPGLPPYHPHESAIAVLERKREWCARHGRDEDAGRYAEQARTLRGLDADGDVSGVLGLDEHAAFVAAIVADRGAQLATDEARVLFEDSLWADRFRLDRPEPVAADRALATWIEKEIAIYLSRSKAGEISPAEVQAATLSLNAFRDWLGATAAIDSIDAACWQRWYLHLLGTSASVPTKTKRLRYARKFVRGLASLGLIPVPPNLAERYRFNASSRDIPMPDVDEIRRVIVAADGQLKLQMLLMLNCAFTQVDVSNLRQDEVDWKKGRIRRKRSKTRDQENVPSVDYPLWPETFSLLRKYRQEAGELVLLTGKSGRPWIRDHIDGEGKRHKVDMIATNYARFRVKAKTTLQLKMLRKAGASLVADNPKYAHFHQRFLGHAPSSIAERHYVGSDAGQDEFDRAVNWLGSEFGFTEA